jgi:hypothetical protein
LEPAAQGYDGPSVGFAIRLNSGYLRRSLQEVRMRGSPSIVPDSLGRDVYLVLDDYGGGCGLAWSEADVADTGRPMLIRNLLEGLYFAPVRIVAFNTAEGWSRDVTDEIAAELACADLGEMPPSIADFIADHTPNRD